MVKRWLAFGARLLRVFLASPAVVSVAAAVNLPACLICDSTAAAAAAVHVVGVSLFLYSHAAHKINIIGTKAGSEWAAFSLLTASLQKCTQQPLDRLSKIVNTNLNHLYVSPMICENVHCPKWSHAVTLSVFCLPIKFRPFPFTLRTGVE